MMLDWESHRKKSHIYTLKSKVRMMDPLVTLTNKLR